MNRKKYLDELQEKVMKWYASFKSNYSNTLTSAVKRATDNNDEKTKSTPVYPSTVKIDHSTSELGSIDNVNKKSPCCDILSRLEEQVSKLELRIKLIESRMNLESKLRHSQL